MKQYKAVTLQIDVSLEDLSIKNVIIIITGNFLPLLCCIHRVLIAHTILESY